MASYDAEQLECMSVERVTDGLALRGKRRAFLLHITGLGDTSTIEAVMKAFGFHPLAMEDVVNVHQQPKVDVYDGYLFVVTRYLQSDNGAGTRQLSMFLGANYLVTFAETEIGVLEPVWNRLKDRGGVLRRRGCDFLLYAILDAVVDEYFPLFERFAEQLDVLEDRVAEDPERGVVREIHAIRSDVRDVRRHLWRQRDAIGTLLRLSTPLITGETKVFLRDCQDHTVQLVELSEVFHESCTDLRDVYLSAISNRMNEIMMMLTVIATIFIPLSFIASVYGMNFNPNVSPWNMPELNWRYGYPFALGLMALVGGGMLVHFRRLGWIGGRRERAAGVSQAEAGRDE